MDETDPAPAANVGRLQQVWEGHARQDPLWAIISTPSKRGGKWDLQEFLATGEHEIAELFATLRTHQIEFDASAALDFGCGVGRLSQALARRFEKVCGVDIAPTMIENARQLNQYPAKCSYFLNAQQDLRLFGDAEFSFIYSNVVLQHIPPEITRCYLAEFARVLKPGGLLVFQLPSRYETEQGLPDDAFTAAVEWLDVTPSCPAGIHGTIHVRVTNASTVPWSYAERIPVMLGDHWLDAAGNMVRFDDGRVLIPNGLAPGESVEVALDVSTPPTAGRYIFELDLVQESVAWFATKGSPTLRATVELFKPGQPTPAAAPISPNDPAPAEATAENVTEEAAPAFEGFSMHVIARHEVVDLLYANDVRLEFIRETDSAGPGYHDYMYIARKMPARSA